MQNGLLKKVYEFSVLYDAKVTLIIFTNHEGLCEEEITELKRWLFIGDEMGAKDKLISGAFYGKIHESPVHGPRELGISGVRCIAVSEVFVVRSVLVGEADNESNNTITMVLREAATMVPQD
uniref:MADS-box domain-containing protein n=1 Tax=Oryza punctata TaxID=4537 RepID=A0A0E0KQD5_ORYPU